jgi:predicted O-methyltransferase YrrM
MLNLSSHFSRALPEVIKVLLERRAEAARSAERLRDSEELARLDERLRSCHEADQYLAFARDVFALNQIPEEILALIRLLQQAQPRVVGEIGTYRCGNLFLLRHTVTSIETLIGVDRVLRQKELLHRLDTSRSRCHLVEGQSRARRTISSVSESLGGGKFDFLFIDGDHTYEGVKADFLQYREFVREGGLIAFHDIVPDLTTRMKSKKRLSKCYAGGVPIFWSEIKNHYAFQELVADKEQDGFGIGVITYSPSISYVA